MCGSSIPPTSMVLPAVMAPSNRAVITGPSVPTPAAPDSLLRPLADYEAAIGGSF